MEQDKVHHRLHAGEYRVLRLLPSVDKGSPLEGKLITVSGEEQLTDIEFDALSYVWGDLGDTVPINIDGLKVQITRNLDDALRQLRQTIRILTLWVDAICINQTDLAERSHQVKRMGTIYRQARRVYMWVGQAAGDLPAIMRLLKAVVDPEEFTFSPDGYSIKCSRRSKQAPSAENSARASNAFANDQEGCIALTNLLSRPYWRRMWIFQEVILATEAVIRAGPYSIAWSAFVQLDAAAENPHVWLPMQVKHPWVIPLRKALFNIMHLFMAPGEASGIHNTLQPTRHLQASDPRDKLYALIGVWGRYPQDLVRLGLDKDASIDYAKPIRDVYTDFARRVIATDGNLSILLTAGIWNPALGPDLGIPSWVPDMRGSSGVDVRFLASYHLKHFNASGSRDYKPLESTTASPDYSGFRLRAQGIMIDRIMRGIYDMNKRAAVLKSTKALPGRYKGRLEAPADISGKSCFQVVFGTLIFEHKGFISGPSETVRKENMAWMKRLLFGFCRELETSNLSPGDCRRGECHHDGLVPVKFDVSGFLNDFKFPEHQPEHGTIDDARPVTAGKTESDNPNHGLSLAEEYNLLKQDESAQELEAYRTEFLYRCGAKAAEDAVSSFFIGDKWHIGTGPWNCKAGDIMAVLAGCPTPVLLRRVRRAIEHDLSTTKGLTGEEYQLVGPCYLYGMMNGEVFEQSDPGDIEQIYLV